ncbi:hypothetical protein GCM10009066_00480 [Halarchaeum salinum]|uniref:DUF2892 domain-containing protein n=1 Tax=Halarchaeum salinum TaxID=489912 RepID=A0AAV3S1C0_9EURY
MSEGENNNKVLRSRIGVAGESIVIGTVLLAALTTVLRINGNSIQFSLTAGIILGAVTGICRYLVQNYRS